MMRSLGRGASMAILHARYSGNMLSCVPSTPAIDAPTMAHQCLDSSSGSSLQQSSDVGTTKLAAIAAAAPVLLVAIAVSSARRSRRPRSRCSPRRATRPTATTHPPGDTALTRGGLAIARKATSLLVVPPARRPRTSAPRPTTASRCSLEPGGMARLGGLATRTDYISASTIGMIATVNSRNG